MKKDIADQIKEAGLKPKEAEIYLAILHLGEATVSDIAKKSKVKRTTIYEYTDELVRKGLLYKTVRGKRIFYAAENPDRLIRVLENKKKKIDSILPDLQKIYGASFYVHKPQIRFYEGIEGIRTIYKEISTTSYTIYGVFSVDKYFSVFTNKDSEEFFGNIRRNGGQIKDLIEDTPLGRKYMKSHFYNGIGFPKLLPKDFKLAVDLIVAGDKVAMISLVNLVGVIIENPEIAELQRTFLKFMRRNHYH